MCLVLTFSVPVFILHIFFKIPSSFFFLLYFHIFALNPLFTNASNIPFFSYNFLKIFSFLCFMFSSSLSFFFLLSKICFSALLFFCISLMYLNFFTSSNFSSPFLSIPFFCSFSFLFEPYNHFNFLQT